jgi:hypothetical protein
VALPFGLCESAGDQPAQRITADLVITRLATDRWRVDYTFDVPVAGIIYGPPVARFREQAWRVHTPGVRLAMREGLEALIASDSARSSFSILVDRYTEYAPDYYAPLIPYSDGGAALFLGAPSRSGERAETQCIVRLHSHLGLPARHDGSGRGDARYPCGHQAGRHLVDRRPWG